MSDLGLRTATGLVLIALALLASVQGGTIFAVFVAAIATVMYYEWSRLVKGWGFGWHAAGFVYALLPALALLWIRERDLDAGWSWSCGCSSSPGRPTSAPISPGRTFGRRKLAPTISPNKTVEGLYGGIVGAALFGGLWAWATGLGTVALPPRALVRGRGAGRGPVRKRIKRRAGVKDSGNWLPGHGGLLDRLDGLIPVAILTAAALTLGLT